MLGVTKVMDVTRERLAAMVGVSVATVSRWEDDLRRPKPDAMHKLAEVLEVSPAWLDYGVIVARSLESEPASGERNGGKGDTPETDAIVNHHPLVTDLEGGAAVTADEFMRSVAGQEKKPKKRRPA